MVFTKYNHKIKRGTTGLNPISKITVKKIDSPSSVFCEKIITILQYILQRLRDFRYGQNKLIDV